MAKSTSRGDTREVGAELVSLGGAVVLGVCILMSLMLLFILLQPVVQGLQLVVFVLLVIASWLYLVDSCTEYLRLTSNGLEYGSRLSRKRIIPLQQVQRIGLIHEGFNLERGIETIELISRGGARERISLGPCWQRRRLQAFLQSLEETEIR